MAITEGDRLPDATLIRGGDGGPEAVELSSLTKGRRVALFAVPGAFTGTCSTAHVPSFIRTKDGFAEKGIDTIICVSVNDPFVMKAWGEDTGATPAGIEMLGDADGTFTKAMGMDFDAPPAGLFGRSKRYALIADDGVVKTIGVEESPGVCEVSAGEALLEKA
ncbi:peroxiredoxin [Jannaschia aquimarina]|uniref:Glutathione-dependent peroxiredoxin n=1 Tax=Jannaschia aquimarina TaxID=935700 RepID=A0A0D1EL23_9RHOB|nr:peroxiredoxin [Jannaschia aquimarina]KIT17681.1 putative peroxiredoxin [Jannaschia aquimarina]SNS79180.1 thiol peroxidase (atypical 2-Cys peroxiredoxin) [Jannaschia aquimarina]